VSLKHHFTSNAVLIKYESYTCNLENKVHVGKVLIIYCKRCDVEREKVKEKCHNIQIHLVKVLINI
jgi:hypothetical protein